MTTKGVELLELNDTSPRHLHGEDTEPGFSGKAAYVSLARIISETRAEHAQYKT